MQDADVVDRPAGTGDISLSLRPDLLLLIGVVASLGNATILSGGEEIRLLLIVAALLFIWVKYRGQQQTGSVVSVGIRVFGLLVLFVYTQFDPAHASGNRSIPQPPINWFFVVSSIAAVAGACFWIVSEWFSKDHRVTSPRLFSRFDWIVIAVLSGWLALMAGTAFLFGDELQIGIWRVLKTAVLLPAYTTVVGSLERIGTADDGGARQWRALRINYGVVLCTLGLAFPLMGYKYAAASYHMSAGVSRLAETEFEEAIESLEKAMLRGMAQSDSAHLALGEAFLGTGNRRKAYEHFAIARKLELGSHQIERRIGAAAQRRGYWEDAIGLYRKARRLSGVPDYLSAELCLTNLKLGQRSDALEEARELQAAAMLLQGSSPQEAVELGLLLLDVGNYAASVRLFGTVPQDGPSGAAALYGLGAAARRTGEMQEGLGMLDRALSMDPTLADAWYEKGQAYIEIDNHEEARQAFEKTLEIRPDDLLALGSLSAIHESEHRMQISDELMQRMKTSINVGDWRGRFGPNFGGNGFCYAYLRLHAGRIRLNISASGTPASGVWPIMTVRIDGQNVGSVSVVKSGTFPFDLDVDTTGVHRLSVSFGNDSRRGEIGDRNLYVGSAQVSYLEVAF